MTARQECEFYLLRYVPDPVRNEFVHVGVILRGAARTAGGDRIFGSMAIRFTSDWRRVRRLDPEADTGMLEGLEGELRRRFVEEPEGNLFHVLEDSFSNCVQMTQAKGYLAESLEAGVDELMRLYVEPQKRERAAGRMTGRTAIVAEMRAEFERAGVWDLLRKRIAASQYTRPGDPLRIDCGYRNGAVKMFQAVSLDTALGADAAKGLAFSAAGLRAGVERAEGIPLELTAIVETFRQGPPPQRRRPVAGDPGSGTRDQGPGNREQGTTPQRRGPVVGVPGLGTRDQGSEIGSGIRSGIRDRGATSGGDADEVDSEWMASYRFAVETLEEQRIRVLTTADLGRVAETARRELRV